MTPDDRNTVSAQTTADAGRTAFATGDRIKDSNGLCGVVIRRNPKPFYGEYEIAFAGFTDWRYASQMNRAALAAAKGAK